MWRNETGACMKFSLSAVRVTRMGDVLTMLDKTARKRGHSMKITIPGAGDFIARAPVNFLTARGAEKVCIFVAH